MEKVLRLVHNEKKSAVGYIFMMLPIKLTKPLNKILNGNDAKYKDVFTITYKRWECQVHQPLHAAAHYLNPEYFYQNAAIENRHEVTD